MTELVQIEIKKDKFKDYLDVDSLYPDADSITIEFDFSYLAEANQIIKQHPTVSIVSFEANIVAKSFNYAITTSLIEFKNQNRKVVARFYAGNHRFYVLDLTDIVAQLKQQHDQRSLANDGFVAFDPDDFGVDDPVNRIHNLITGNGS